MSGPVVTTQQYHCNLSSDVQRRMRATLREYVKAHADYRKNDLSADVILEGIWNAAMGN